MRCWVLWFALGTLLASGCTPEVVIARDRAGSGDAGEATGGAGASSPGEAGASSEPAGGVSGAVPSEDAGAGGRDGSGAPFRPRFLLADSVADFSLVQGERGWYYGFDNGTPDTFMLLTRTSVVTAFTPPSGDVWECWTTAEPRWTQIFQLGAHPNGTDTSAPSTAVLERAVRRWESNYAGDVRIVGELAKLDLTPGGSNGVVASILLDGIEIYSVALDGNDAAGMSYETGAHVAVGSMLDFVLDPLDGKDHHDLTRFTAVIERATGQSGEPG